MFLSSEVVVLSVVKMGDLWYIRVSAILSEHLWFLSLERSSVLGIRRLEIDIGGLEVGRMSEFRSRKAGSRENLHFFRDFLTCSAPGLRIVI